MITALIDLPCAICSCQQKHVRLPGFDMLMDIYNKIAEKLLIEDSNNTDRKLLCDMLAKATKHRLPHGFLVELTRLDEVIIGMLSCKTRGVRLAAGYVLSIQYLAYLHCHYFRRLIVEFFRIYEGIGKPAWGRVDHYFHTFQQLVDGSKDTVKETILICVGSLARSVSSVNELETIIHT